MAEQVHTETRTTTHTQVEQRQSMLSNVLAIIGFIILIVIVLWGLFHIASLSQPWLSSLFKKAAPALTVTIPSNAISGDSITVSWKYSTPEKGMYAFLYQCKNNFRFETTGNASAIPCGAAYAIQTTSNTVGVTPTLSGTASTSVPVSVIFIPSATSSKQAQGTATVVVHPKVVTMTPVEPAPVTPAKPVTPTPVNRGPADLSVSIISVTSDGSGNAVATFDIGNVGGNASGSYYFTAQLPMNGGYTYTSPVQYSLAPGDHIVNTLRFAQAVSGNVSVVVDPQNMVSESSESNNYTSQFLNTPYNYNQPYYPNQYPYVY
ncbi:MAG: CARDB domain-containing protein [bacterium]|nr:CARDB domain-containing protein [bacterium]